MIVAQTNANGNAKGNAKTNVEVKLANDEAAALPGIARRRTSALLVPPTII